VRGLDRGLFAPTFFGLWLVSTGVVAVLAGRWARGRAQRYRLGAALSSDAFAPVDVDLVRRTREGFELTVVPGMTGTLEGGRAPLPLETTVISGNPHVLRLEAGAVAEVASGTSVFRIRGGVVRGSEGAGWWLASVRGQVGPLLRRHAWGFQIALLASLACMVPNGQPIRDRVAPAFGPRWGTPWEVEKALRAEAQSQARSLHRCFDDLALSCQRPGYVGVGLSLNREGEVRSNWIARSTYGADCPVEDCMKEVISTWTFDPLHEPMRLVLPVQVLRTGKPLPTKVATAAAGNLDVEAGDLSWQGSR
jgi:hypothetical protein